MKLLLGDLSAWLLVGLTLGWLPAYCLSKPSQHFEVQPEAQYLVHSGHDARLRCLVRDREGECLWLRDGRAIGVIAKKYQFVRSPDDGDCSLTIRNVSVQQDDGSWQCQVTASDVDRDSLQSRPVQLLVLVAPERALIKNVTQDSRLALIENVGGLISCEIRGGNPAPQIEWYLDGKNVSKEAQTSSFLTGASSLARITESRLRLSDIKRSMNGKNLTCVGVHQTRNQSTSVELDVQYEPSVSVLQRDYSIVEGSPLSITCQVDSNPAPTQISWRLVSDSSSSARARQPADRHKVSSPVRPGPLLEFERISREQNQNVFECYAQNERGLSPPVDVRLNVLYAPIMLNTSASESVLVGSQAQLECLFDGNPEPEVKWLYTDPLARAASSVQLDNKRQQLLTINNVTYRNEGDYHCEARNQINGVNYGVRSSNIILDVYGEPQFLSKSPVHTMAVQGSRADLALTFCSDPPPNKVFWQFGSLRLDVRLSAQKASVSLPGGAQPPRNPVSQRFQVHPLLALQKRDSQFSKVSTCFEAQLSILEAELSDQRDYTLVVENERGHQSGSVRLRMSSPLSPMLMISSAFVTICGLFLCSLLAMFVLKKRPDERAASAAGDGQANGLANNHLLSAKKSVEHLANGAANGVAAAAQAAALAQAAVAANAQLMQQQTRNGLVSGTGHGLANNASNPAACSSLSSLADDTKAAAQAIIMSMSSANNCSDSSSANDQRQLLVSTSTSSSPSAAGHSGASSVSSGRHQLVRRQLAHSTASSSLAADQESNDGSQLGSRSPAPRMTHISLEDDEPVQAEPEADQHRPVEQPQLDERALIYANLEFQPRSSLRHLRRQQAAAADEQADQELLSTGTSASLRSSVGATIALMNSLAAQQQQQQPSAHAGVLNGAINQQLANSRQLVRKPGPPKPPKPSIQQRNRFYQQQQAGGGGLVMIGHQLDAHDLTGPAHYQASPETSSELAAEYSRIAFPARAEL